MSGAEAATRLVVRGSDEGGVTITLEQVYSGEDPAERLRVWSAPAMSSPFDRDVHLATERVTTTYERVTTPTQHQDPPC